MTVAGSDTCPFCGSWMPPDVAACPACGKANPALRFQPPASVPGSIAPSYPVTSGMPAPAPPGVPGAPLQLPYVPPYGGQPPLGAANSGTGNRAARLVALAVILAVAAAFAGLLLLGHSKLHDVSVPSRLGGYDQISSPEIDQTVSGVQSELGASDSGGKVVGAVYGPNASDPEEILFLARLSRQIPNTSTEIDQFAQGFSSTTGASITAASATQLTLSGQLYYCWQISSSFDGGMCIWIDGNVFGAVICKAKSVGDTATVAAEARADGEQ